jgi:Kelch motif
VPAGGDSYNIEQKERMKYPRHGHSCCSFGENLIFVTGSRKDIDKAPFRTEMYNTVTNKWIELAQFKSGRHYHSSCSFQQRFVYIFCGISNETKKYLNQIERLEFNQSDI